MDAAQVIAKTMAAAKRPLTDEQQILLAGALAVCMEKAAAAERAALLELAAATGWGMANSDTFYEAVHDICQMREKA